MKQEVFTEYKAEQFLKKYLPVAKSQLTSKFESIKVNAPLVLKLSSPQLLHKTEINAVRVVKDKHSVQKEFEDLLQLGKKKNLKVAGIVVQEFCEGTELIIGIKKDPVFNHVIVFGIGGIFTEILKDTATRKCPITLNDAHEMIEELRSSKLFHGARGISLNVPFLAKTLVKASQIPAKYPSIKELDINPFILNKNEGKVADARIVFES